jgi:hypothetical protein
VSLLAALERNDLSRWPKGIFRRAFLREYVVALGLPPEPIVAEFVRLFPDGTAPELPPVTELRLTFEGEPSAASSTIRVRAIIATVELCGVTTMGSTVGWLFDVPMWSAIGVLALTYYSLASVLVERTPHPHLIVRSARPKGWLDRVVRTIKSTETAWRKPGEAVRRPLTDEELDDQTATAAEWGTASN